MYKDDKPLAAPANAANAGAAGAAVAAAPIWSTAQEQDALFEDILDIEGPLRLALASPTGAASPSVSEVETAVAALAKRVPEAIFSQLRIHTQALRVASNDQDKVQVRANQAALVDALASLREALN